MAPLMYFRLELKIGPLIRIIAKDDNHFFKQWTVASMWALASEEKENTMQTE